MSADSKCLYREGYKYQLAADMVVHINLLPPARIEEEYFSLDVDGRLWIKEGYASDGPSGPTIDTKNFMRGAFAHDALYAALRHGHLPQEWREKADRVLVDICKADGMSAMRRWVIYNGLRLGGAHAAEVGNDNPVIEAP